MTFKEKVQTEHPEMVDKRFGGGVKGCPYHYGYEKNLNCMVWESNAECEECWNREMPNTEPNNDIVARGIIETEKIGYLDGYDQGLNDAWEFMRKYAELTCIETQNVYGVVSLKLLTESYTPQEALAKLKAYEEQVEVGDVVETEEGIFVVSNIIKRTEATTYFGITRDGKLAYGEDVKKTGKHIDIKSFLEQIGE